MRNISRLFGLLLTLATSTAPGQGTFIYDQQTSTDETPWSYGSGGTVHKTDGVWGQSFTPSLPSVEFIKLMLIDSNPGYGSGATMYLNLHSGSMTGALLGTTDPVSMGDGFRGPATFLFAVPVSLTAGTEYFFDLRFQSGTSWNVADGDSTYQGGRFFSNGFSTTGAALWFREGIVSVPEPSPAALVLLGLGGLVVVRRFRATSRTR